jgi:hypothetical protein
VCERERERRRRRRRRRIRRRRRKGAVYCKEYYRKPISTSAFLKSKFQN